MSGVTATSRFASAPHTQQVCDVNWKDTAMSESVTAGGYLAAHGEPAESLDLSALRGRHG